MTLRAGLISSGGCYFSSRAVQLFFCVYAFCLDCLKAIILVALIWRLSGMHLLRVYRSYLFSLCLIICIFVV